jgi:superfamily II DNA helicase RecQ
MHIRVVTLRYSDGLQGFPEDALRAATAGREVLEVREHFFLLGNVPHLALVLCLSDGPGNGQRPPSRPEDDPGLQLPEVLRALYRSLREWRNETAKQAGIPSYTILRNTQLAEICKRLPRTLAALREIDGIGEATATKYGAAILALLPTEAPASPPVTPPAQPPAATAPERRP